MRKLLNGQKGSNISSSSFHSVSASSGTNSGDWPRAAGTGR
jgi:hypothetical protein